MPGVVGVVSEKLPSPLTVKLPPASEIVPPTLVSVGSISPNVVTVPAGEPSVSLLSKPVPAGIVNVPPIATA